MAYQSSKTQIDTMSVCLVFNYVLILILTGFYIYILVPQVLVKSGSCSNFASKKLKWYTVPMVDAGI